MKDSRQAKEYAHFTNNSNNSNHERFENEWLAEALSI